MKKKRTEKTDTDSSVPVRKIRCPHCRSESIYSLENPHRPFCSERCKINDLGSWAAEDYRVIVPLDPNSSESLISSMDDEYSDDDKKIN